MLRSSWSSAEFEFEFELLHPRSTWSSSDPEEQPRLVYSDRCGRVLLDNVTVQNVGIDWHHPGNVYWQHKVQRHEAMRILLRGRSEFEARNVRFTGNVTFEVPDGFRMVVSPAAFGTYSVEMHPLSGDLPSWEWVHSMTPEGAVRLDMKRHLSWTAAATEPLHLSNGAVLQVQPPQEPFQDYII